MQSFRFPNVLGFAITVEGPEQLIKNLGIQQDNLMKISDAVKNASINQHLNRQELRSKLKESFPETKLLNALDDLKDPKTPLWKNCHPICDAIEKFMLEETTTTTYMIYAIGMSCLKLSANITIKLANPQLELTNIWEKDKNKFTFNNENDAVQRMIVAAGPSGCGKTRNIKVLLPCIETITTCFTIDGGMFRDTSWTYQLIAKYAPYGNTLGLFQLYKKFKPNKEDIIDFLIDTKFKCSICVPDTLVEASIGKLQRHTTFISKVRSYIGVKPNENDIGVRIWQHLKGEQCPFPSYFKCKGCMTSGVERAIYEGKKYSPNSYFYALKLGISRIKKSNIQFDIHNSGQSGTKSILFYVKDDTAHREIIERFKQIPGFFIIKLDEWPTNNDAIIPLLPYFYDPAMTGGKFRKSRKKQKYPRRRTRKA